MQTITHVTRRLVLNLYVSWLAVSVILIVFAVRAHAYFDTNILGYNTSDCGGETPPPIWTTCLIVCGFDLDCQALGFNRSEVSCACPCQACKAADGTIQIYGAVSDLSASTPLTEAQVEDQCPHSHAGCSGVTYPQPPTIQTKRVTVV